MISKEFFTTGEAAELLHISRSTISRNYDKGIFAGRKNPITGERLIGRESLTAFMEKYNLALDSLLIPKKKILLGTPDEQFLSGIQKVVSPDDRIQIERVTYGGDIIVRCSRECPDLLIVDEELPDIPCKEVIKSLRRTELQNGPKILCGVSATDSAYCLEWGADEALTKNPIEESILAKKIYFLLEIPPDQPQETKTYEHQRRWPRIALKLPTRIGLYCVGVPYLRDSGKATMDNISRGGAYLSEIQLEKKILPGKPFRILLEIDQPPLEKWRAHCKVVRLQSNGSLSVGLQFVRLSKMNRKLLEGIS